MNSVNCVGRLTADPELRQAGDHDLAEMRVAVNHGRDKVVFVGVKAFDAQGRNAAEYLQKGSLVAITGRLEQDQWTGPEGERRSSPHYVVADRIDYLDRRPAPTEPAAEIEAVGF